MSFPANVHVSSHPVLASKLSQLRQKSCTKEARQLSTELASILSVWVSGNVFTADDKSTGTVVSAAGGKFSPVKATPGSYVLVPVLRSGLAMVDRMCKPSPVFYFF